MRYFLTLARTGSITKSAGFHSLSAPAFSKAMRVFEDEVGQKLTIPSGRGLILTDYARSLVNSIEHIVKQIDAVKSAATAVKSDEKHLKVATFEVFSTYFMTKALKDYFADYRCELHEASPGQMEGMVACGKVDLALTYIPIPHAELDHLKVQEIEMGIFGKSLLFEKCEDKLVPFVIPIGSVESSPNRVRGLDGWPDDAFPRNAMYQVGMLESALGLCREGLAVAYLPKFIVKLHNEIVLPALQIRQHQLPHHFPKAKTFVYLVKRKTDVEGVASKRMAQAIRKICK